MKKAIIGLIFVSLVSLVIVSCGTGGNGGTTSNITLLGLLSSYNIIAVFRNATVNFSDVENAIGGDAVTDATVTASNESSGGTSASLLGGTSGVYTKAGAIASQGQDISLKVVSDSDTVTGAPTQVPNPFYNVSFFFAGPSPLTITWEVQYNQPVTYEASHTWVTISNSTEGYQVVVPITTTSIDLSSAEVTPGMYSLVLQGVNPMDLNGAHSNSRVYVGGGGTGISSVTLTQ
jgi:hypothetical protein